MGKPAKTTKAAMPPPRNQITVYDDDPQRGAQRCKEWQQGAKKPQPCHVEPEANAPNPNKPGFASK